MKQIKNSFHQVLYQVRGHVKNSVNFNDTSFDEGWMIENLIGDGAFEVESVIWIQIYIQIRIISYDTDCQQ